MGMTLSLNQNSASIFELIQKYAVVTYPMAIGLLFIVFGAIFDQIGHQTEAGVVAALGVMFWGITVVVYVIYWLLGRYGT